MRRHAIVPMILGLSLCGCSDPVEPPSEGVLAVSTSTSGDDPDPDGFQLRIDGVDSLALLPTGTAELDLSPGRHTLQLVGVAEHCSAAPGTSVEVDITAGRRTPVAFQVSCPGTSLQVAVTTTGQDPDQDGYVLTIDGADALALDPTETAQVKVAPGRHTLQLGGVADHCSVSPGAPLEVDITRGSTISVALQVSCPLTGARITVTTTGFDFDPDGYRVVVDDSDRGAIASSGTMLTKLDPGSWTISLAGLASNCAIEGSAAHTVTIVTAEVATIDFVVVCTPLTPGFIWGQVLEEGGGCIRGAMVEIVAGPGMGRKSGQPDPPLCNPWGEDGFWFYDLPLGATVTLRATAPGYQSEDRDVVVPPGGAPVQFVLQPNAPLEGRIAFASSNDIYVMDADGSNPVNLTKTGSNNFDPAWSRDGTRIAFASGYDIFVMNADGSNPVNLTFMPGETQRRRRPAWSPDGRRIAFTYRGGLYVMNADGSNVVNLSNVILSNISGYVYHPRFVSLAWSPNGTKIAFSLSNDICCADIWVADADGSNPRNLTRASGTDDHSPAWSPDGTRIAHSRRHGPGSTADIYVMDAAGFAVANLSNNTANDREPAWSPDGRHIAFESDREDSDFDIYVMDADGANQIRLTDRTGSDRSPVWAP